jgi:hypothetical protein
MTASKNGNKNIFRRFGYKTTTVSTLCFAKDQPIMFKNRRWAPKVSVPVQ